MLPPREGAIGPRLSRVTKAGGAPRTRPRIGFGGIQAGWVACFEHTIKKNLTKILMLLYKCIYSVLLCKNAQSSPLYSYSKAQQ